MVCLSTCNYGNISKKTFGPILYLICKYCLFSETEPCVPNDTFLIIQHLNEHAVCYGSKKHRIKISLLTVHLSDKETAGMLS